jgi:hypothetical protein
MSSAHIAAAGRAFTLRDSRHCPRLMAVDRQIPKPTMVKSCRR